MKGKNKGMRLKKYGIGNIESTGKIIDELINLIHSNNSILSTKSYKSPCRSIVTNVSFILTKIPHYFIWFNFKTLYISCTWVKVDN